MILSHIAALSINGVIGNKGQLPWHLPEDLKFFRLKTLHKIMIMGRKTLDSFPDGKLLPHRVHIVLSQSYSQNQNSALSHPLAQKGVHFVSDMKSALKKAQFQADALQYENPPLAPSSRFGDFPGEEVFIIGGGEVFTQSFSLIQYAYLTLVHEIFEGDVFYPHIPQKNKNGDNFYLKGFHLIERKDCPGPLPFSFLIYKRK